MDRELSCLGKWARRSVCWAKNSSTSPVSAVGVCGGVRSLGAKRLGLDVAVSTLVAVRFGSCGRKREDVGDPEGRLKLMVLGRKL